MENNIPLAPVSGWTIGPIKAYEAITFKLDFLTNSMQPVDEANQSPQFLMTAEQAMEFSAALERALLQLKTAAPQAMPGQKH